MKWNKKEDQHLYDLAFKSFSILLERANIFVSLNPSVRGLFEGQKGKKKRKRGIYGDIRR